MTDERTGRDDSPSEDSGGSRARHTNPNREGAAPNGPGHDPDEAEKQVGTGGVPQRVLVQQVIGVRAGGSSGVFGLIAPVHVSHA
jgi:hypothetical protein